MKIKNNKGIVLAESLMTVALLTIASTIMGGMINGAIDSIRLSRDFLIAQNLVTEGGEAVKSVKDTNWLLNPTLENCWLNKNPDTLCNSNTAPQNQAILTTYKIADSNTDGWTLANVMDELDLVSANTINSQYRLYFDNSAGFEKYTSSLTSNPSPFYRQVKFLKISKNSVGDYLSAEFEAKVQWFEGRKVYSAKRSFIMQNK